MQSDEVVQLEIVEGHVQIKDQMQEYINRGDPLEEWSYLDFFLGTYDGLPCQDHASGHGRPRSVRVPYKNNYRPTHCRLVRSSGHETMPYFPGLWFPKRDGNDEKGMFEASMLALLKPWRKLDTIKKECETFQDAFEHFLSTASQSIHNTIENIQFFHECSQSAKDMSHLFAHMNKLVPCEAPSNQLEPSPSAAALQTDQNHTVSIPHVTENQILHIIDHPFSVRESTYAKTAVEIGHKSGLLSGKSYAIAYQKKAPNATQSQLDQLKDWGIALNELNGQLDTGIMDSTVAHDEAVTQINEIIVPNAAFTLPPSILQFTFPITANNTPHTDLNAHQHMAHNIVSNSLRLHLAGCSPPQRLMLVQGEGGTGKSALLNAISATFEEMQVPGLLAKTAMSGVAASVIGGQTLHSWAALPIQAPCSDKWVTHPSKEVSARRKKNIAQALWLTIDEMSMLTAPLLALLHQVTSVVRSQFQNIAEGIPFGGLNVILLGDFNQLPPVASSKKELYNSSPSNHHSRLGRNLFQQFDIVITLEQQMRITDPLWCAILKRARTGDCTARDIAVIRKLVLTNADCHIPDFLSSPWDDAILVTPRNSSRTFWNEDMVNNHCQKTGQTKYILYAHDTCSRGPLTPQQRLEVAHLKVDETNHLPNKVEFAVGMKTMILHNIAPDADLANGSRGIITDVLLDPREPVQDNSLTTIVLKFPPAAIFFAPMHSKKAVLHGLPLGVVPVLPITKTFTLGGRGGAVIHRLQLPLTAAYAFTDYKAQGQTIECVIVDLGKTPTAGLTPFNAYVALSRSRGRQTIRLLRDFDEKLFTTHPSEELRKDDCRLQQLAIATQARYDSGEFNA